MTRLPARKGTPRKPHEVGRLEPAPAIVPFKRTEAMVFGPETKYVQHRFSVEEFSTLELTVLTDLQVGSHAFKEEKFLAHRTWLLESPARFVFLCGDLVNATMRSSVGHPRDDSLSIHEQINALVEYLAPLKENHRLLGYVGGNHERRGEKESGSSWGLFIAERLGVPYSKGTQEHDIFFGQHNPFAVSIWHGTGAARTKGAKAQMLHRFMQQADSQLYLCGHLHDVVVLYDWRKLRRTDSLGRPYLKLVKIAGVMSSSFQDYWDTYAEVAGHSPSDALMARAILTPDGRWEVTLK